MKYVWSSYWYKVVITEKDGMVSGKAEWNQNGRLEKFVVPAAKINTKGKVYEQTTARNVYAKIIREMWCVRNAEQGRLSGPLCSFKRARIVEDSGQVNLFGGNYASA